MFKRYFFEKMMAIKAERLVEEARLAEELRLKEIELAEAEAKRVLEEVNAEKEKLRLYQL
jgi:hypothetical protein